MAVEEHKGFAPPPVTLRVAVVTASDSRTPENNEGGRLLATLSSDAGFAVAHDIILRENPAQIRDHLRLLIDGSKAGKLDGVLITGGTGVAGRDSTIEALAPLLDKTLPGFGELFRMLSFAEIGAAAMLSRAMAGTAGAVALFAMPGSPAGVRLAMERLIVPELPHLVGQLRREHHHHG